MRMIALAATAATALALSACGSGDSNADGANTLATDNLMMDPLMDANASMDGLNGMDANASTNAATGNMMMQDTTTGGPDTNLANGL